MGYELTTLNKRLDFDREKGNAPLRVPALAVSATLLVLVCHAQRGLLPTLFVPNLTALRLLCLCTEVLKPLRVICLLQATCSRAGAFLEGGLALYSSRKRGEE